MEKDEIFVGKEYAYLLPGRPGTHEPLRVVIADEPEGGFVEVVIHHPDIGQSQERVKTREVVGRWDDEPEARFSQYHEAVEAAREQGSTWTWADIAAKRYGEAQRQRALASRLSRMGIRRASKSYAGAGGSSTRPHDTDLQLSSDELEHLLDRAERGPGVPTPSFTPAEPEVTS